MNRFRTFALLLVAGTALTGWASYGAAPKSQCGPALSVSDPQLRDTLAAFDRDHGQEFAQVCALYRDKTEGNGPARAR